MTKVLQFPVSCTYDDNFMLDLDPIHLDAGITDIDGIHENGDVSFLTHGFNPSIIGRVFFFC